MIHTFKAVGQPMLLDVGSGAVHAIDDMAFDVLEMWNDHTPEEIRDALKEKYTAQELDDIVRGNGCTVLYIQTLDDIFVQSYADLFTDKLAAAQSGETLLYRVTDAGFAPMPMEVSAQ